jgi:hypothetical protein
MCWLRATWQLPQQRSNYRYNNQLVWGGDPPCPRSIGIIELGERSRRVFEFK